MWKVLDHTADVALAIEARSWPELFEEAARGFGAWMSGGTLPTGAALLERALELRGADAIETWVHFWKALHRLWTVEQLLPVGATVEPGSSATLLRATIACIEAALVDPGTCQDVKAVTWHGARVEEEKNRGGAEDAEIGGRRDGGFRGGEDRRWIGTIVLDL